MKVEGVHHKNSLSERGTVAWKNFCWYLLIGSRRSVSVSHQPSVGSGVC